MRLRKLLRRKGTRQVIKNARAKEYLAAKRRGDPEVAGRASESEAGAALSPPVAPQSGRLPGGE